MHKIILDCERMKYPHTGLYHFCLQLGRSLLKEAVEEAISFFMPRKCGPVFGTHAQYIYQHAVHKWILPATAKYNVWHATHQGSQYFPANRKIPVVLTVHDLNFLKGNFKSAAKRKTCLQALQHKIDRADHITTISQFVLDDLHAHIRLNNKPATVIYNGCNINAAILPAAPLVQPGGPFLFTIGTIAVKKNFHVLPALLVNNDKHIVIAGIVQDEAYKKEIIAAAQKNGVLSRVHFTGPVTEAEKYWYYQHCEAFVFPSLAEGFGLPVIEAMAFGKPVFLSTQTSLPEIGGEDAFYFNDFDPENMREILQRGMTVYSTDTGLVERLKARAYSFNWQQTARQYIEIYRGLY